MSKKQMALLRDVIIGTVLAAGATCFPFWSWSTAVECAAGFTLIWVVANCLVIGTDPMF